VGLTTIITQPILSSSCIKYKSESLIYCSCSTFKEKDIAQLMKGTCTKGHKNEHLKSKTARERRDSFVLKTNDFFFVFVFLFFAHFWSVTLVSTNKTTLFTPPSVISYIMFLHAFTCFDLYIDHLQKAINFFI
jgi:hypothetical protein